MRLAKRGGAVLFALFAVACPGNGSRLVEDMLPGDGGPTVTLTALQEGIFGGVCVNCHAPGKTAAFMRLDNATETYASLVNQESLELPPLLRVAPGDPENSYLIWKIEGRDGIAGERMPPPSAGEAKLSNEEIAAIRQWILDGAAP